MEEGRWRREDGEQGETGRRGERGSGRDGKERRERGWGEKVDMIEKYIIQVMGTNLCLLVKVDSTDL